MSRSAGFLLVALFFGLAPPAAAEPAPAAVEFFEKEVRPLLIERCLQCHGDSKPKAHLQLTTRAGFLEGGRSGPAVVAAKPEQSLLIQALQYRTKPMMPPDAKLKDHDIAVLTRWVQMGLPWPEGVVLTPPKPITTFQITEEQRRFWSFQPVQVATPPAVKDAAWCRSDVDCFILAALEARGLLPARPADKRTLIRRATFDLTGLPPTPEEIDAFLADNAPDAFARVVDRLLTSPRYGERWGRHWLDLVRYADSFDARGLGGEGDISEAWRYRDWVVAAFNHDLPYDQFLTYQLAGDLLPDAGPAGIVATGMLAIGNWGGGDADKEKLLTDIVDEQIDVVGRTFLGLTLVCARCHDHKFDPISTADYYALGGIFFSTHILPNVGPKTNGPPMLRIPLVSPAELAKRTQYQARVAELEKQLKAGTEDAYRAFAQEQRQQTGRYLLAAWDYQNRPAEQAGLTVADFATARGLLPFALRQWIEYLGMDEYRLMTKAVRDVHGFKGVHGWKGEPDSPSLTVNTTDREVAILTFKLPPKSVAVHPGPSNGVAIAWKSPISGTVKISGRVVDADPVCGDGIAWIIDHRQGGGRRELAAGDFANGGSQKFADGKGAERLTTVEVQAGDTIELLVLPKATYICDTTVVELVIARTDGSAVWDLTRNVVEDPHQDGKGNPHSDRLGNPGVWHFLDMAGTRRTLRPEGKDTALAQWERVAAQVAGSKLDRRDLEQAAQEFQKTFDVADARSPFWISNREDEKHLPSAARATLAGLAAKLDTLKKNPPSPAPFANGAQEGGVPGSPHAGIHDVHVHIRGSYARLGDLVPRRFPEILAGDKQAPITQGSGRLQLAQWLTRPEHPLTARVMVNRLWQYHFGEGLVRTPSNFGKLGQRPTHPELLDYLAAQFVQSGWSIKKMHRLLMLSAVYQQDSEPLPETLQADPDNRLLGRMNRRRLEAEAVRDNLLAVAARLDAKMGGPATRDFASPRRTLYEMTIRSDRSGFGPLFDVADSTALVDRRTISTVAPQALFLMNHPFVLEQARTLANRLLAAGVDNKERIGKAYVLLYGRPPVTEEVQVGLAFLNQAAGKGSAAEMAWHRCLSGAALCE